MIRFPGMPLSEELATLVTIMLLGHWIEMKSVFQAQGALKELAKLLPSTAERIVGERTETIPVAELRCAARVWIRAYPPPYTVADVLGDVFRGAIAGFLGTMAMGRVTTYMYQHEDPRARQKYEEGTGGNYPPERTAEAVEERMKLELSGKQHKLLAKGSHQMVGIGAGVAYALARRRIDWADAGQGLLFGTLFFLAFDEGLASLMGFAEPPQEYPWQAHARGFAGHLAYGLTAETALDVLDAVA